MNHSITVTRLVKGKIKDIFQAGIKFSLLELVNRCGDHDAVEAHDVRKLQEYVELAFLISNLFILLQRRQAKNKP